MPENPITTFIHIDGVHFSLFIKFQFFKDGATVKFPALSSSHKYTMFKNKQKILFMDLSVDEKLL